MKFLNDVDANDNNFLLTNSQTSSAELVVSSTDSASIISFSKDVFRSAKFFVQTVSSSGPQTFYCVREILALHDDVDGFLTEYAVVGNAEFLEKDDFDFSLSGSNAVLSVSPTTVDDRNIKVHAVILRDYEFLFSG